MTSNNAIDMNFGKRVLLRRKLPGMSDEQLGIELNITVQQAQKYERGSIESTLHVFGTLARF